MMDIVILVNVIFIVFIGFFAIVIFSATCEPLWNLLTLYAIENSTSYICVGASLKEPNKIFDRDFLGGFHFKIPLD